MSDHETVIVVERQGKHSKRAFSTWEKARYWRDQIKPDGVSVTLSEVLLDDLPPRPEADQ